MSDNNNHVNQEGFAFVEKIRSYFAKRNASAQAGFDRNEKVVDGEVLITERQRVYESGG